MEVVVDGVLAHYEVVNPQADQICVVLHGWGQSGEDWLQLTSLLPQQFQYVLVDLPGHGGTGLLPEVAGVTEYGIWVQELLEKLQIGESVLLGHSFGGQIAVWLAWQQPELVERLLLVAPAVVRERTVITQLKVWLFAYFSIFKRLIPERMNRWLLSQVTAVDYYGTEIEHREILKRIVTEDQLDVLAEIKQETWVYWGEVDEAIPFDGKRIVERLPRGRLRVLWGMGHNPHATHPNELAEFLVEGLR